MNTCPARFFFIETIEAKKRLAKSLKDKNVDKMMSAPVTVIVAHVLVQKASVGWEYRMIKGVKTLCKVQHPAVYKTVSERVMVQPASKVAVRHPAIYSTQKEKVLVQPASSHVVKQPAVYKTVNRQVLVQPARTVWQPVKVKGCRW